LLTDNKSISLLALLSLLAGCASLTPTSQPIQPTVIQQAPVVQPEVIPSPPITDGQPLAPNEPSVINPNPSPRVGQQAVASLMSLALNQQQLGNLPQATSTIERALRIEPENPRLYRQLADLQLLQKHYGQAEQLALKGLALAVGQPQLVAQLWRLIAVARGHTGDTLGAQQAVDKAQAALSSNQGAPVPQ
jgi:predicted Zn-dependent protease